MNAIAEAPKKAKKTHVTKKRSIAPRRLSKTLASKALNLGEEALKEFREWATKQFGKRPDARFYHKAALEWDLAIYGAMAAWEYLADD